MGAGGVIINLGSINSFVISNIAPRYNVPYCVAKAGVAQLTRGMAANWAPYDIRVNAIAPGTMLTAQTAASRKNPEIMERIIANTPMKRYGDDQPRSRAGGLPGLARLVLHDRQRGGDGWRDDNLVIRG